MILIPKIDKIGRAFVCGDREKEIIISCASPLILSAFCRDSFNPKEHDAAILIAFKESKNYLIIESPNGVPMRNIYCPDTGKILIKYEEFESENALVRIS